MTYIFIARACTDLPVSTCCRVMKVSTSGYYAWQANPVTKKDIADAYLTDAIVDIHRMSRRSYGSPRVHAELRLGEGISCSKKRVERLIAQAGIAGIHRRRRRGCTRRDPDAELSDDLVKRAFDPEEPDHLWVMDVTEHPTGDGKAYLAVVLDAFSRRVVGWSVADHMRSDLVVDALQMAVWRRRPAPGSTIAHSDTARPTRPGRSAVACGVRGCSVRWALSGTASTIPWPRAFSARCSSSCSTSTAGRAASSWHWRSSNDRGLV